MIAKTHTYNTDATNIYPTWGNYSTFSTTYLASGSTMHYYFKDLVFYEYETGETPAFLGEMSAIALNVASVDSTQWTASSGTVLASLNTGFTVADTSSTPLVTTDTAMTPAQIKMSLSSAPTGPLVGLQLTSMAKYSGVIRGDLGSYITTNSVVGPKRDYPLQAANTTEMPIHSSAKAADGSVWTKALIEASQVTVTI